MEENSARPRYARPHEGKYDDLQILAIGSLIVPAGFALTLICLQPKPITEEEAGTSNKPAKEENGAVDEALFSCPIQPR